MKFEEILSGLRAGKTAWKRGGYCPPDAIANTIDLGLKLIPESNALRNTLIPRRAAARNTSAIIA